MTTFRRWCAAGAVAAAAVSVPAATADAATYRVTVTCQVPRSQPERQLAANSCLNYVPDGTQTYTARVTDSNGRAVPGVWVSWSDSSSTAHFRVRKNPCRTGSNGTCSDELVERSPRRGAVITVRATVGSAYGLGYLRFA
jgi:hypothetical protein